MLNVGEKEKQKSAEYVQNLLERTQLATADALLAQLCTVSFSFKESRGWMDDFGERPSSLFT
jgi:hypothetical protein